MMGTARIALLLHIGLLSSGAAAQFQPIFRTPNVESSPETAPPQAATVPALIDATPTDTAPTDAPTADTNEVAEPPKMQWIERDDKRWVLIKGKWQRINP